MEYRPMQCLALSVIHLFIILDSKRTDVKKSKFGGQVSSTRTEDAAKGSLAMSPEGSLSMSPATFFRKVPVIYVYKHTFVGCFCSIL
jgi:hypothetical protein